MLNIEDFKRSIKSGQLTLGFPPYLQALWHDGRGDWVKAHALIDQLNDKRAAHVHAYLHRKEGDLWNADYWYNKAGQKRPDISFEEEWNQLVYLFHIN